MDLLETTENGNPRGRPRKTGTTITTSAAIGKDVEGYMGKRFGEENEE